MTLKYYQDNAQTFFDGTVNVDMSSLYETFTRHLAPGARVLDAGCGSGRDAKAFLAMGYQVEAFDASSAMVELAREHTGLPVQLMTFADVDWKEEFHGIWCCASLLHVPAVELTGVMRRLADALKPGGVWYVSFKYGDGERELDGRRFTDMDELGLSILVQDIVGIEVVKLWITQDKRPQRNEVWLNVILSKNLALR
ncbi:MULTISPECIES: bifunctional 2-polyprenyl-6-hydroxyphenol methylase/3-demethylubiquinol 3-O-methyltransferase UbiG [unclassified Leclercia]|uniref:Class I SAM-dependent methyltransferase n=1 Tax=Leclercia barmai TaxID=2785629 RepID=A0ABS7RU12_9ENTR|nr:MULTISPECIES: class I SAM-dependent methyltransferase [unclassified Leclercia]MBZ0057805.1 class I SAM-dependent methyltransferase [Leclercia sp. EMC7]MCM5696428.1 class I SAM-dependent methyltransferase [Leclercia sp. LTM01]MCM5700372.1 class I SAM-dependent methyltransferase [Leclercia sp. LTM14]